MVTCWPDISYAVIKLSQYSSDPAEVYYKAARQLMKYLALTKSRRITYWRNARIINFPDHTPDHRVSQSEVINSIPEFNQPREPHAYVDSDLGGDRSHQRSVTGLLVLLAGGNIAFKSKNQNSITLSSTKAEFTAAAEAGKTILYLRSILRELGYDSHAPTLLY